MISNWESLHNLKKEGIMIHSDNNQLVEKLAHTVIVQIAPDEMPFFQATSAAYFKNPREILAIREGKEEKLGFGLGEMTPLLTPIVLYIVQEAITIVTTGTVKATEEEGVDVASKIVKKLFKKAPKQRQDVQNTPLSLTSEQLMQVRQQAFDTAHKLNIPDDTAQLLADALAGSLIKDSSITVSPSESAM